MNLTTRARHLQTVTSWPYQTCLQRIRDLGARPSVLAKENQWSIERADAFLVAPDTFVTSKSSGSIEQIAVSEVMIAGHDASEIMIISEKGSFRPTSLTLPEDVARDCLIFDIQVGKNSQFVSSGQVHGIFFAERHCLNELCVDPLQRGMTMRLLIHNLRESEPLKFSALVMGKLITADCPDVRESSRSVLGLGFTTVPPNSKVKIALQPQVVFTPDCLVLAPSSLVRVVSVRIVGCEVLTKGLQDGRVNFVAETMQVSDWLCIEVVNDTDSPQIVFGGVGGAMVV